MPTFDMSNTTPTALGNTAPGGPAQGALPANLGVTPGAQSGGNLLQGSALPNITTTNQAVTSTPQFYTDYLNQLATQGAGAAQNAQFAGVQPMQQQAYNMAQSNVGNYQPALQQAQNLASSVGNSNIVNALGNLNTNNIANSFAPNANAGIVGSGGFGSSRGIQALGNVINSANLGTQVQQAQAMQTDMQNRLAASQQLGNLASQTQQLGLGDVNALSTLGGQQQTIAQNQQMFPLQALTAESNLMRGLQIPTAVSQSYTGPIPGAYANSPLSQIAGVTSGVAGFANTKAGEKVLTGLSGLIDKGVSSVSDLFKPTGNYTPDQINDIYNNITPDQSIEGGV